MRHRSDLVAPLTTLLVGAMLVVATQAAWPPPSCGPDQAKTQGEPSGDPSAVHVVVLSSSNKGGVMEEMACRFERTALTVAGEPVDVVIVSEPSGAAIDKIGASSALGSQPTVWTPASSSWVSMLQQQHPDWIPKIPPPSIAQSPQVIAMPRPIAESLGWPRTQLGWKDILDLATHPQRWAAEAPGFGTFKLAMTNPLFSTSGMNATVSTFRAATGHPTADLVKSEVGDGSVLRKVRQFESTVVHYAPTSVDFLRNLQAQDDVGHGLDYVSAILLEEKSVWDYNQGNPSGDPATLGQHPPPTVPLAAFYPSDGALFADHPYVILTADWVSQAEHDGAQAFLRFLEAPEQQGRFQALGYRDRTGAPGLEISDANGLIHGMPPEIQPPEGDVLQQIRAEWPRYRKRARVLILMDVSGSMASPATGAGDETKLQLAQAAAKRAIRLFGRGDEVGLWAFSPASARDGPYVEEVPIAPLSSNEAVLRQAIDDLSADPGNGTELYSTIAAAVAGMVEHYHASRINGIILLTDGTDDGTSAIDRPTAIRDVALQPDREVRIFTIAYGARVDATTLADLAQASQGTAYDATTPTDITKVFDQVVASF